MKDKKNYWGVIYYFNIISGFYECQDEIFLGETFRTLNEDEMKFRIQEKVQARNSSVQPIRDYITRYHLVEMLSEATDQHKVEQVKLNIPIFDLESVLCTLDPSLPINTTAINLLKRELAYLNMCLALSDKMLEATKAEIRMQCTEDEYISILKEVEQVG